MSWNLLEKDVDIRCMVLMSQMVIRLYDGKEKRKLEAAYKERGLLAGEDCAGDNGGGIRPALSGGGIGTL